MAEICDVANADVVTLSNALGYDQRTGPRFLKVDRGFGVGCLPKDIRAFSAWAGELGAADAVSFLREIDKINLLWRECAVSMVGSFFDGDFLGWQIAVLGAALKPNSDDVRDSPALTVAASMQIKGASVRVHDPQAIENAKKVFPTLTYCNTFTLTYCNPFEDACRNADMIVLAAEWDDYLSTDSAELRAIVRQANVVDARRPRPWSLVGVWTDGVRAWPWEPLSQPEQRVD